MRVTKDKNGENVPQLEATKVVLFHWNLVNNGYQHDSRVLYQFTSKKCGSLINIPPSKFILLETCKSEFSQINVWFANRNFVPLQLEDKINFTLVIDWCVNIEWDISLNAKTEFI